MNFLHIFGQPAWHDSAYIVGTKPELLKLKIAIERLLSSDFPMEFDTSTSDGEGFTVQVMAIDNERYEDKNIMLPYTAECAQGINEDTTITPWDLWLKLCKKFGLLI